MDRTKRAAVGFRGMVWRGLLRALAASVAIGFGIPTAIPDVGYVDQQVTGDSGDGATLPLSAAKK